MVDSRVPLAEQIRPQKLTEFIGQKHLVGKEGIISKMIRQGQVFSCIFYADIRYGHL